jgi:YVTN family beta-propeller protein
MGCSSISVRALAAIVALCALFCLGAASASAAPLALTSNYEVGSVSVINTETNEYVGEPIDIGGRPKSIAITPDGRFAYVANEELDDVSVIDLAKRRIVGEPIAVGEIPGQIAISPDGKTVYVVHPFPLGLSVIDTQTNRVIGNIPLGAYPTGIAISPDGMTLYAAEQSAEAVEVVDTQAKEVVGSPIHLKDSTVGVAISPDGKTIYVGDELAGLAAINAATRQVKYIPTGHNTGDVAVSPDGETAWLTTAAGEVLPVIDLLTGTVIEEVPNSGEPSEIAFTPDGKSAYVLDGFSDGIRVFDTRTFEEVGPPIVGAGVNAGNVAITPDQSPTAAFTAPDATVGVSASFSGAASTDLDGSIAAWNWSFGDGGTGTGVGPSHAYQSPGTYDAKLSVVDNEGCGEEEVFTGRTAYCSGNVGASVTHPVTVKAPPVEPIVTVAPSNKFRFGRLVHNRHNGTARLQVKLPSAGFVLLFGNKVHAVTRKSKGVQSMWLTIHARVELNKRLKKILRAPVRIRVTFTPNGGRAKTVLRTVTLQRAPHRKHARH